MLVGYVSDEKYVALPDVMFEFGNANGSDRESVPCFRRCCMPNVEPGTYRVTLNKPVRCETRGDESPSLMHYYQFRLLSDCLLILLGRNGCRKLTQAEVSACIGPKRTIVDLWRYGLKRSLIRESGMV